MLRGLEKPAQPAEVLFQIVAPHFTAGLVCVAGRVVKAAPILRWTQGRALKLVQAYCEHRGWHLQHVAGEERMEA